ncbi:hypothetical protein [Acidiphilium acidophilum]|uniref:hypothetical protein n=1 Tax=Acidiphilium acidophilum TaxID=76588 RepID=UPI002F263A05
MSATKPALRPHPADAEALAELREIAEDRFARPSHRVEARRIIKAYASATCRQHQRDALAGVEVEKEPLPANAVMPDIRDEARDWPWA